MSGSGEVDTVLAAAAHLGEGPVWDRTEDALVWVDILAGLVHRYRPATGRDTVVSVGQPVGAAVPRASGGLALAVRDGFGVLDPRGGFALVARVEAEVLSNRMNDGKCDAAGRFWAGTMDEVHSRPGAGALYRLDPSLEVGCMVDGVTISNGLDWSPDGTTMYYIDTPTQGVDAFDFDPDAGALSNRRRIIDIDPEDGAPDGMAVDAEGCLWVALWDGWSLRRYAPGGSLDRSVPMPAGRITSCAFGGPDLDDLYVTSARRGLTRAQLKEQPLAGSLFHLRPGVQGLPAHAFSG
jgi:sugar lactone lactonase YvrE